MMPIMKNIKILPIVLALFFSGCLCSCNDWLETGSNDEVLEDDALSLIHILSFQYVGRFLRLLENAGSVQVF